MKRVIIESPYKNPDPEEFTKNKAYLRDAIRDCIFNHGEAPYASHALFAMNEFLDDLDPEEREIGITAGLTWGLMAEASVVYTDRGISEGMKRGILSAAEHGRPVEYRSLAGVAGW